MQLLAGAPLTTDPALPSGQRYVHSAPTRRERIVDTTRVVVACAALMALGIGAVRLVPIIGEAAPGSGWRAVVLLFSYPVVHGLDLAVHALTPGWTERARSALHASLTLVVLTCGLRLYLADVAGAALAAGVTMLTLWALVRTTPQTLL